MTDGSNDPMKELEAMGKVAAALKDLDSAAKIRVLKWAADAFGTPFNPTPNTAIPERSVSKEIRQSSADGTEKSDKVFESIADLYSAAQPTGDSDKALVAGYWFQIVMENVDFDSQSINTELKHLGHGVSNITQALGGLMGRKPQLVIQTRKSGTSQQSRKRYKITHAGQQAVERLIRNSSNQANDDLE